MLKYKIIAAVKIAVTLVVVTVLLSWSVTYKSAQIPDDYELMGREAKTYWAINEGLMPGQRIWLNTHGLTHDKLPQGTVVYFERPDQKEGFYLARILGVQGDIVEIKNGKVSVNQRTVSGDYVIRRNDRENHPAVLVPEGYCYVMPDDRKRANHKDFGVIPYSYIKGRL